MKSYFLLLVLLVGIGAEAASPPSPVYRSAPTVLKTSQQQQQSQPQQQPQQQQPLQVQVQQQQPVLQASPSNNLATVVGSPGATPRLEERESQSYQSGVDQQNPNGKILPTKPTQSPPSQEYSVMYFPQPQQQPYYGQIQQPYQGTVPGGPYPQAPVYDPVGGGNGAVAPASDLWSSLNWKDAGVALACIALIGAGSALWYPNIVKLKARAMRELNEFKTEDVGRMAQNVMRAIRKFSEMNNARE